MEAIGWISKLKALLSLLLPNPIPKIIEKGLLRFLCALILIFVIVSPLIVLLAAFWLEQLERIDSSIMQTLRDTYIEIINKGFSVEKVASRSNVRLDYLQPFDADLTKKNQHKTIRISIQPRQKAELRFGQITYKSDSEDCIVPEDDPKLASVLLDDELIAKLSPEDSQKSIPISESWWRSHQEILLPRRA